MEWQLGMILPKVAISFIFFSDNAREAIAENQFARLEKSDSIQKRKRLENTYENCAQLLQNAFNVTQSIF